MVNHAKVIFSFRFIYGSSYLQVFVGNYVVINTPKTRRKSQNTCVNGMWQQSCTFNDLQQNVFVAQKNSVGCSIRFSLLIRPTIGFDTMYKTNMVFFLLTFECSVRQIFFVNVNNDLATALSYLIFQNISPNTQGDRQLIWVQIFTVNTCRLKKQGDLTFHAQLEYNRFNITRSLKQQRTGKSLFIG